GKWAVPDLYKLSDLLVGLPLTLDHDWDEVGKVVGRCFDSRVLQAKDVSSEILDKAGNYDWNKKIIKKEGHYQAIVDVFVERESAAEKGLRYGRLNEVSVGGFRITDFVCPLCEVSFTDDKCPHLMPSPWLEYADPETRKLAAPYYVRSGVYDLMELSFVTTPNCCNAGTVKA
ncbi:MAG: hypothetical protein EBS38_08005, partial [Actinobacteria bacterium]|nr:hypothetical protein [Actinomycetota bacterium]